MSGDEGSVPARTGFVKSCIVFLMLVVAACATVVPSCPAALAYSGETSVAFQLYAVAAADSVQAGGLLTTTSFIATQGVNIGLKFPIFNGVGFPNFNGENSPPPWYKR